MHACELGMIDNMVKHLNDYSRSSIQVSTVVLASHTDTCNSFRFEDMLGNESNHFDLLIDRMTVPAHPDLPLYQDPSLPILHFATPLEGSLSPSALHSKYILLLKAALSAAKYPRQPFNGEISIEKNGSAAFSYNLAMTTERMAICPRSKEGTGILGASPDSFIAINGTILGGTLMVKDEAEWNILRQDSSALEGLLASLGYPLVSWTDTDAKARV
jgi:ATP adenylyltransferase